jgi:alpha-L-fucosidase
MPKHHDGFAMYDSRVTDYDIIDTTPFIRDPIQELSQACIKYGVRFGIYYSHATDWMDGGDAGVGSDKIIIYTRGIYVVYISRYIPCSAHRLSA